MHKALGVIHSNMSKTILKTYNQPWRHPLELKRWAQVQDQPRCMSLRLALVTETLSLNTSEESHHPTLSKRQTNEKSQAEGWRRDSQDCPKAEAETLCRHAFPDPPTLLCPGDGELLITVTFKESSSLSRHHHGKEKIFQLNS